jgi:RNA polymerase sigma-70 factor (sigma-E family)
MEVHIVPNTRMGRGDHSGGSDPFSTFYRERYPSIARLAYLLTSDAGIAEDLAQDAFTEVHTRFESLTNPSAYLRTTVVNLSRRRHRSREREAARVRLVQPRQPVAQLEVDEFLDVLGRLSHDQRMLVVLRYWADWTEAEIAEALNCRRGTVKSRAARALAQMRDELELKENDK